MNQIARLAALEQRRAASPPAWEEERRPVRPFNWDRYHTLFDEVTGLAGLDADARARQIAAWTAGYREVLAGTGGWS